VISVQAMRRDYGERAVLRDVSFELAAGQTLAVLGPNGAGKSTLLRILATLLRPSAGDVSVLGARLPKEAWRARGRIGYLGHHPLLYRELSVRENLLFNASLHGLDRAGERVEELLGRAGLARRGGELVRNLSAGMLQRAAVCRALLHGPELLLLDEPRSHLDASGAGEVARLLAAEPGRTRVIVTHEIERGLTEADQVLALHASGRVAHAGPVGGFGVADARELYAGADGR